jgi:hypothetical protein
MTTIVQFKKKYQRLTTTVEREQFLLNAREEYKDTATPAMRKFLNKCIKEHNDEVARTKNYASKSLGELKKLFTTFTTAAEMRQFILDVKGIYAASNNAELRRFLNECTKTHNAMVEESYIDPAENGDSEQAQYAQYAQHAEQAEYAQHAQQAHQTYHAEYMEQAAQAVQAAYAEDPEYTGGDSEEAPDSQANNT